MAISIINTERDQLAEIATVLTHILTGNTYLYDKCLYVVDGVEKSKDRNSGDWYLAVHYHTKNKNDHSYSRDINSFLEKYREVEIA